MKEYLSPEMEMILFTAEDIMDGSNPLGGGQSEPPATNPPVEAP